MSTLPRSMASGESPTLSYSAYGLTIGSSLPLPELVPVEAEPDVFVHQGGVGDCLLGAPVQAHDLRATATEARLFYEGVGAFLVRGGREILVEPRPGVDEGVLRLHILGVALGVLLHQRGYLVLHANALAIDKTGVVLLGDPGSGKSTLSAALRARGHKVLADDVTAIDFDPTRPKILPGFPQLKLWPEAAMGLGESLDALPRLHSHSLKRAQRLAGGFQTMPVALTHAYILVEGSSPEIIPLQPQDAFLGLLRHSYCKRVAQASPSTHLRQCGNLVTAAAIKNLRAPRSSSMVSVLARFIEDDVLDGRRNRS